MLLISFLLSCYQAEWLDPNKKYPHDQYGISWDIKPFSYDFLCEDYYGLKCREIPEISTKFRIGTTEKYKTLSNKDEIFVDNVLEYELKRNLEQQNPFPDGRTKVTVTTRLLPPHTRYFDVEVNFAAPTSGRICMGNVDSWLKTARLNFFGQQHFDLSFVPCRISKAVADTLESSYSLNEPIPGSGEMSFVGALIGHCGQKCKDSMQKGETDTKLNELIEEGRQFWQKETPIETQIKDNFSLHSFSPSTTIELVRSHFPTECYDSHLYHFPGKRFGTSKLVGSKYKSTVNQPSAFYTKWKTALTNQFNQLEWPEQENFRKMISAKLTDRLQKVNPFLHGTIRKVIVNTEKRNCVSDQSRYCAYYSSQKDSLAFRFEVVFDASQGIDETNVSNSIESQFTWKEKLDGKSASKRALQTSG